MRNSWDCQKIRQFWPIVLEGASGGNWPIDFDFLAKQLSYFRGSRWTRLIISKLWVQGGSEEEFGFCNRFGDILEWPENLSLGCPFSRCRYLLKASVWGTKCFTHWPLKCTWDANGTLSISWPYPMFINISSPQVLRGSGKTSSSSRGGHNHLTTLAVFPQSVILNSRCRLSTPWF